VRKPKALRLVGRDEDLERLARRLLTGEALPRPRMPGWLARIVFEPPDVIPVRRSTLAQRAVTDHGPDRDTIPTPHRRSA
jgi:hypothetical protein